MLVGVLLTGANAWLLQQMLAEILLNKTNTAVMTRYIADPSNLKLVMTRLRDKSRHVQFEAFHVFKVFVANPEKRAPILDILVANQTKILLFLETFQQDRQDERFSDEKAFLVAEMTSLTL